MDIISFFAGIAFFYYKNLYSLLLALIILFFRPKYTCLLYFFAAIYWAALHEYFMADQGMPRLRTLQKIHIEGYIDTIPSMTPSRTQFQFLVKKLENKTVHARILLSCYRSCPAMQVGQHIAFEATLKRPKNYQNLGSFDYISYLSSHHIHWIGSIDPKSIHILATQKHSYLLSSIREHYDSILYKINSDEASLGIMEALTIGLTHHIDKTQWELFRRTGTTHLIDISGEHIVLVAGFFYGLFKALWKRIPKACLRYPAPKVASVLAILCSFCYALLSGFSVPTQRAFITSSLFLVMYFGSQRYTPWQSWRYALLLVLLLEPHSVFMLGFYFSFLAVSILIITNQRVHQSHLKKFFIIQGACLIGLMPLSLYWFSYASLNGFLANLIAIPWVSIVIVPLALLIVLCSPLFVIPGSMYLLKLFIYCLLSYLHWVDILSVIHISFGCSTLTFALFLMLALYIFYVVPIKNLYLPAIIIICTSIYPKREIIHPQEAIIDILDVGQGLASVVRTKHHVLIYDTGMKFYQSSDIGSLVIIPYLEKQNIRSIDTVVLSHPDLDHRGGFGSIEKRFTVNDLIVDDPSFYKRGRSCHSISSWEWDGVSFQFFPIHTSLPGKNNYSCVLLVSNKKSKILFTGDIEKQAEAYLIKTYGQALHAEFLLIPHHGSKTSSSKDFVHIVHPKYGIVSYGLDNRYHFPHKQSMQHYKNIPIYSTATEGMIRIKLLSFM